MTVNRWTCLHFRWNSYTGASTCTKSWTT